MCVCQFICVFSLCCCAFLCFCMCVFCVCVFVSVFSCLCFVFVFVFLLLLICQRLRNNGSCGQGSHERSLMWILLLVQQWPQEKRACGCIALHVVTFRELRALIFNGSHRSYRQMWSCRYMARPNTEPVRHNTVAQKKNVPVCQQAHFPRTMGYITDSLILSISSTIGAQTFVQSMSMTCQSKCHHRSISLTKKHG